ncbi:MAG TPA: hypothetical protein PLI01_00460 [Nitrospira sp.]|nr:hypothetical protein [Nitrospira sp.]HNA25231.1 hypothetical protein [Nitrospira sp.]HNI17521.1 hypothetical protein [Nitrospira sp.]
MRTSTIIAIIKTAYLAAIGIGLNLYYPDFGVLRTLGVFTIFLGFGMIHHALENQIEYEHFHANDR